MTPHIDSDATDDWMQRKDGEENRAWGDGNLEPEDYPSTITCKPTDILCTSFIINHSSHSFTQFIDYRYEVTMVSVT